MSKLVGLRGHLNRSRKKELDGFDNLAIIPDDPSASVTTSPSTSSIGPTDPFWVALQKEKYAINGQTENLDGTHIFGSRFGKGIAIVLFIAAIIGLAVYLILKDEHDIERAHEIEEAMHHRLTTQVYDDANSTRIGTPPNPAGYN